jgi:hypothetical protein
MDPMKLYAELQLRPRGLTTYRKLADYYREIGMANESEAFLELIRKKFDGHSSHPDEEQRQNHQSDT